MTDFSYNGCGADVSIGKNIDLVLFRSTPCAERNKQQMSRIYPTRNLSERITENY